jgi:tetratricopeptide (TPR) repeat protein
MLTILNILVSMICIRQVLQHDNRRAKFLMRERQYIQYLLIVACFSVLTIACDALGDERSTGSGQDAPLKSYQIELLNVAFETASAVPVDPHIKSRSRGQQTVVRACLELKQPRKALRYIERIDNWRRGAAYAEVGSFLAQHGAMKKEVEPYLSKAAQIAERTEGWRRNRIRVRIAQAYTWMREHQQAQSFTADVEDSEAAAAARVKAMVCSKESFKRQMKDLDTLVSARDFDMAKNALGAYSELYKRFYPDLNRRKLIEDKMRSSWDGMPISIRIDLLAGLADCAIDHGDQVSALKLVTEAKAMLDSSSWQPRFGVPLRAGLAGLLFRSGDQEHARAELQNALDAFDVNRQKIVNIDRAGILRSVAEAYQVFGDIEKALDLYGRAIEAGIENPNSRPRAEDLTATCCSMAQHEVEPSAELWNRIRKIREDLGDPW